MPSARAQQGVSNHDGALGGPTREWRSPKSQEVGYHTTDLQKLDDVFMAKVLKQFDLSNGELIILWGICERE